MKASVKTIVTFASVFTAIYGGAHVYLWWRLVHPLHLTGLPYRLTQLACLGLCLSFPLIHFCFRQQNGWLVTTANLVSSVWMGAVVYFVLVTFSFDLVRLLFFRTLPMGRVVTGNIAALVTLITIYGLIEAHLIGVTRLRVRLANLPAHLEGLRLVQISDVHMGLIVRGSRLERIVTMVNDLQPDLIVITGDLVDAEALHMEEMIHPLRRLTSRYGVYAVAGNHEYYAGIEPAQKFIEAAGVTMLRNRWVTVADGLQLVGRDDPAGRQVIGQQIPSLREIVNDLDRSKPAILLYHTPVTTLEELRAHGIQLQLSGHTHRGQLWPFNFIVKKLFRTPYGKFTDGETTIYVSRGTGTWGPPLRVGAQPEITLVTLSSTAATS